MREQTLPLRRHLATRSYVSLIKEAKELGYEVSLIFFWLPSVEMAKSRVKNMVSEGGHNIPSVIIEKRYSRGIYNLINLYIPAWDNWWVYNNANSEPLLIALGLSNEASNIIEQANWNEIVNYGKDQSG